MNYRITLAATLLTGVATLTGCTYQEAKDCTGMEVSNAWVRQAPGSASVQAGYFTLTNSGGMEIVVHSVDSPDFGRVEMHETVTESGTTKMKSVEAFRVPPRTTVSFQAGGKHLMLFNPRLSYASGDRVQLQFVCGSDRARTPVAAEIRSNEPIDEKPTGA